MQSEEKRSGHGSENETIGNNYNERKDSLRQQMKRQEITITTRNEA